MRNMFEFDARICARYVVLPVTGTGSPRHAPARRDDSHSLCALDLAVNGTETVNRIERHWINDSVEERESIVMRAVAT